MEGPGRKSLDALSVVTSIPGQRPDPPEVLTEREAEVWKRVAAARPAEWFTAETHPLLAEYCRAWIVSDQLAAELKKIKRIPTDEGKFRRWMALRDRQDKVARLLATLATKMRLSQQSRWTEKSADTAVKRTAAGAKPWDYGKA